jgi:hypothetical protein
MRHCRYILVLSYVGLLQMPSNVFDDHLVKFLLYLIPIRLLTPVSVSLFQNPIPIRDIQESRESFEAKFSVNHLYMAMDSSRAVSGTILPSDICSAPANHAARFPLAKRNIPMIPPVKLALTCEQNQPQGALTKECGPDPKITSRARSIFLSVPEKPLEYSVGNESHPSFSQLQQNDQDHSRETPMLLACCSDSQRTSKARSIFLSAPEQPRDDTVGNELHQSLLQLKQKVWFEALPDFENSSPPISSDSRDENEGAPSDQPSRLPKQALPTTKHSDLAQRVLRRVQFRRAPEERVSNSGGDSDLGLVFLQSLPGPESQGPPQRRRSAFERIGPAARGPGVPELNPQSDSNSPLHPETEDALRRCGLLPRDQGQRVPFDADHVFPDPIMMDQPGNIIHEQ